MATIDVGKIRFNWTGAFATGTTYSLNDVVSYSGSSWVYVNTTAKTGTAAGAPSSSNSTHWDLMADGASPLTTAGDVMTHDGSSSIRLAAGTVGQGLKVVSSGTLGFGNVTGFNSQQILGSNVPAYANTTNSTLSGTDGKYPWLAQYNGKSGASADWIPYDGMPNGACGPVKRDRNDHGTNYTCVKWINTNYEPMIAGYQYQGMGPKTSGSYDEQPHSMIQLSAEFGGMKADEKFVRMWYNQNSLMLLTNKGNVWVMGENGSGQLGLGDTVDRYQLVRNPYLGPDATNNSITCEVSAIATNDARGYQGMGNTGYMAITHDGRVFSWGWNGNGRGGHGDTTNRTVPTLVSGLTNIVQLSLGYNDSYAVDSLGRAYHTGANTSSISSLGSARTSFAQMTSIDNVAQIMNMCTYYYNGGILASAYVIQTDGDMYGIGENGSGQLGQGNTTDLSAWTQIGGSTNFAAVHAAGNASTLSICALVGNASGQDGPGDGYTYCVAANTGLPLRTIGHNSQGALIQGTTSANSAVNQPITTTHGTNYMKTVTASADGSLTTANVTFPRDTMKRVFPMRTNGYNAPGWYGLDNQNRLWIWGYMAASASYYYQNNTSAINFSSAFMYPGPWTHTLTGQQGWWAGENDIAIEDLYSVGHYYSGYWTHFARMSDNSIWMIGNNYYYQHGSRENTNYQHWHQMNP